MREIKFRGKCIVTDKWLYGDLTTDGIGAAIVTDARIEGYDLPWAKRIYRVYKDTVGQYTGAKDKSNREIYDKHFVKCGGRIYLVKWSMKYCGYRLYLIDGQSTPLNPYHQKDYEIVGNIYENPELLEDKSWDHLKN